MEDGVMLFFYGTPVQLLALLLLMAAASMYFELRARGWSR